MNCPMLSEEHSAGPVAEVTRLGSQPGRLEKVGVVGDEGDWPASTWATRSGFDLDQMESSEADVVPDQVLQWQNLSGIPRGVGR